MPNVEHRMSNGGSGFFSQRHGDTEENGYVGMDFGIGVGFGVAHRGSITHLRSVTRNFVRRTSRNDRLAESGIPRRVAVAP